MTLRMVTRTAARVGPIAFVAMLCVAGCSAAGGTSGTSGTSGRTSAQVRGANTGGSNSTVSTASGRGSSVPCTILTGADVHASFAGTVSTGSTQNPDIVTGPSCTYHIAGSSLGKEADAYVVLPSDETPYQVELIKQYPDPNSKIVPGIGDFAKYDAFANTITFVKHGKVISVAATEVGYEGTAVNPPTPPDFEASLIALAKKVSSRA